MRSTILGALAATLLLLWPTPSRAQTSAWTAIYSKATTDVATIAMFDDARGLAIAGGGVVRTTDGGHTWTEHQVVPLSGGHIAFADAEHAWISSFSGAIWHTADGGLTWSQQPSNTTTHLGPVAVISAQEAWVTGFGEGFSDVGPFQVPPSVILRTTDGGNTWADAVRFSDIGVFDDVAFVGANGWLVAQHCFPRQEYAFCPTSQILMHTTDGGRSWSELAQPAFTRFQSMQWFDATHGYAVRIVCAGNNFTACKTDLAASDDAGKTWRVLPVPGAGTPDAYFTVATFTSIDRGWAEIERCDPAPCATKLYATVDAGKTWALLPARETGARGFAAAGTALISNGGDTGIQRIEPASTVWQPSVTDLAPVLANLTFADRDRGYAASRRGLEMTADGGASWTASGTSGAVHAIAAVGAHIVWTATSESCGERSCSHVQRSDDGGATWNRSGQELPGVIGLQAFDAVRAFAVTDDGLWRTDDGGATWRVLEPGANYGYTFVDRDHGWTNICPPAQCEHAIRVTSDGGDSWHPRELPDRAYAQFFSSTDIGWASDSNCAGSGTPCGTRLFRTDDGGISWDLIREGPPALIFLVFADARHGWALGADLEPGAGYSAVYATTDGGATWTKDLRGDNISGPLLTADGRVWAGPSQSNTFYTIAVRTIIFRQDTGQTPATGLTLPSTGHAVSPANRLALSSLLLLLAVGTAFLAHGLGIRRRLR